MEVSIVSILPHDVLRLIVSILHFQSAARLACTCKCFRDLVLNDTRHQRKKELFTLVAGRNVFYDLFKAMFNERHFDLYLHFVTNRNTSAQFCTTMAKETVEKEDYESMGILLKIQPEITRMFIVRSAAKKGDLKLLDFGLKVAPPNSQESSKLHNSAFIVAAGYGHFSIVDEMIKKGVSHIGSAIIHAMMKDQCDMVAHILGSYPDHKPIQNISEIISLLSFDWYYFLNSRGFVKYCARLRQLSLHHYVPRPHNLYFDNTDGIYTFVTAEEDGGYTFHCSI